MAVTTVLSSINGLKLPLCKNRAEFPKIYSAESAADKATQNAAAPQSKSGESKSRLKRFSEGKRVSDLPYFSDGKFRFSENALSAIKVAVTQSTAKKNKIGKRYETKDSLAQEKKTNGPMSRKNRYNANYFHHFYSNINTNNRTFASREFSISIDDFGQPLHIFNFDDLNHIETESPPEPENLKWTGLLPQMNRIVDKLTPRNAVPLPAAPALDSSDLHSIESLRRDPFLQSEIKEQNCNVVISDLLLATLMTMVKSKNAWDIMVTKEKGVLIFGKRDGSDLDKDLFDNSPEDSDDTVRQNCLAASAASLSFRLAFSDAKKAVDLDRTPLPAAQTTATVPAAQSAVTQTAAAAPSEPPRRHKRAAPALPPLLYRRLRLSPALAVLVRCELHAHRREGSAVAPVHLRALHEPAAAAAQKSGGQRGWRVRLETQRSSVLVDQVREKGFVVARWVAQAEVCGVEELRVGFVARADPLDAARREAQAAVRDSLGNLRRQLGLSRERMWGAAREVCEVVMGAEDGDYFLVKDPNNNCALLVSADEYED